MLERGPAGIERADQIDVDDRLESVGGHSGYESGKISCRSTDDEIDWSMCISRSFDGSRERVIVPDIGRMSGCGTAFTANLFGGVVQRLLRPADESDLRSVLRVPPGDRQSDSATTAGEDGRFPRELRCSEHPWHGRKLRVGRDR